MTHTENIEIEKIAFIARSRKYLAKYNDT